MIKLLLGLDAVPTPHDAADALAIAVCHLHQVVRPGGVVAPGVPASPTPGGRTPRSWRQWKP
jgi:hypothetical protein